MIRIVSTVLVLALAGVGTGQGARAENVSADSPAATPQHETVLEVRYYDGSGRDPVQLSLADLKKLPRSGFQTTTVWTEGKQRFEGVWLKDLADHLGLKGGVVELSALNEYMVEIDAAEVETSEALVAYMRNGEPMSVRDKGPLWLVFPYDKDPKFRTETIFALSIWQLDLITLSR